MTSLVPNYLKASCLVLCLIISEFSFAQCSVDVVQMTSNFNSNNVFGQSFTPCLSGELYQLDLPIHTFNPGTATATLSILEGDGYDGQILLEQEILVEHPWDEFHVYPLSQTIPVLEDQVYTIAVDFKGHYCGWWAAFNDLYSGGSMYWDPVNQPTYDFNFKAHFDPVSPENIWIGLVSSDWHDPVNWSLNAVPDQYSVATIPLLTDNYVPIIGSDAEVKSLQIFDGGSLVLDHDQELKVFHTIMNYGTAEFHGMVNIINQNSQAEILGDNEFSHLKINNTVFLTEPVMVTDLLDLSSGYLMNMGSNLKVHKNDETKGHVYYPDNNIMGDIIIERKYDKDAGVRLISSPVEDAILGDIAVTEADKPGERSLNQLSIRSYDESMGQMRFDNGWIVHTSSDAPLRKGLGYAANFPGGATLAFDGEVSSETNLINATFTSASSLMNSGWHLLGNPYPSILDWESIEGANSLDNAIYFWNNKEQQFEVYLNDLRTFDADRYIQPMEGFFVHTGENTDVKVEYVEAAIIPEEVFEEDQQQVWTMPLYRLKVEGENYRDESVLLFSMFGKDDFQGELDALKMMTLNPEAISLATINPSGEYFAINTIPELNGTHKSIPLYTNFPNNGEYTFATSEMINFANRENVFLEDKYTGKVHNLSDGPVTVEIGNNSKEHRFILHFGFKNMGAVGTTLADIFSDNDDIVINVLEEGNYQVEVFSALGQRVYDNPFSNKASFIRINKQLNQGTYIVKVYNEEFTQVEKVFID
ncbi:MAG: T9SS type A sorting domain-containing protein [Flavobacteriales bacterium]|nr:T9SS type A sorting domain-containing protein [Flavobacteriales bacterium]